MAGFHKMTDMALTTDEKAERMMPPPPNETPDYPSGLCICLTQDELEKLDIENDAEVGDTIHLVAFAKVTSVSENTVNGEPKCRIELQITHLAAEDEDKEGEEAEEADEGDGDE
jgi:formylmethanofuran:tetrahydromethanopterin formyltransferase